MSHVLNLLHYVYVHMSVFSRAARPRQLACPKTHVVCHHTAHVIWSCWFEKVVRVCNGAVLVTRLYESVLLWLQFHEIGLVFECMYTASRPAVVMHAHLGC